MHKFFKLAGGWVNVDTIGSIRQGADGGPVTLHFAAGGVESVSSDDGKALVAWANANCANAAPEVHEPKSKKGEK